MKHDITGGWITLRDPKQVPERLRRPLVSMTANAVKKIENDDISAEALEFYSQFNDLLAVAMIAEWSFGAVSQEVLLDLPSVAYDEIRNIVAPFVSDLMPNFEADADPKAITES